MQTNSFEGDSHERLVHTMRAHWRRETDLTQAEQAIEAAQEKARGDHIFMRLVNENDRLLRHYANGYFRDAANREDGVREIVAKLYQELHDLRDTRHAALWQERFLYCLKKLADAVFGESCMRRYGEARQKKDPAHPVLPARALETRQSEFRTDEKGVDPVDDAPNIDFQEALSTLFKRADAESLLEAIPDPRHRTALWLDCKGWSRQQIAEHLRCSPKSVYNWIESAKFSARAWAEQRYGSRGEFSEHRSS